MSAGRLQLAATPLEVGLEKPAVEIEAPPIDEPEPTRPAPATHAPRPLEHTHAYPVSPDHDARPHDPSLVHAPISAPPASPASEVVTAAPAAAAPFKITVGDAPESPGGSTSARANAPARSSAAEVLPESRVSSPARLLASAPPPYPPEARAQEVEADVALEIVVDAAGRVIDARVSKVAGYGFGQAALASIRAYRFAPAQHDGHAVSVCMRWVVSFRLR
jgi:TonB family protein